MTELQLAISMQHLSAL